MVDQVPDLHPFNFSSNYSTEFNSITDNGNGSVFYPYEYYVPKRDSLSSVIPMTVLYALILVAGLIGNVCTCVVIIRNRYMHTSTNCYLFNLAISDLLLLVVGMPQEIYQLWIRYPYFFGEPFCVIRGLGSETSTNVSILTITSFTVERYLAICHPLKAQANSSVQRAIKIIIAVWIIGGICAVPLAYQFGVVLRHYHGKLLEGTDECTLKRPLPQSFEISTFFFFILPVAVISALYMVIGLKLRHAEPNLREQLPEKIPIKSSDQPIQYPRLIKLLSRLSTRSLVSRKSTTANSNRESAIKMLFAVVVAFFTCWAPFHGQRLLALHSGPEPTEGEVLAYTVLTYISGVTYFLSATINPILYSIMSVKFREAFKDTLANCCRRGSQPRESARCRGVVYTSTRSTIRYEYPSEREKYLVIKEKRKEKILTKVEPVQ